MVSYPEFTSALGELEDVLSNQMRRGITFLKAVPVLSDSDKLYLSFLATTMFLNKEDKRDFLTNSFQGQLRDTGKYQTLVTISGRLFEVYVETDRGRLTASFLLDETTPGSDYDKFVRRN